MSLSIIIDFFVRALLFITGDSRLRVLFSDFSLGCGGFKVAPTLHFNINMEFEIMVNGFRQHQ
jgi:hypothetical protein